MKTKNPEGWSMRRNYTALFPQLNRLLIKPDGKFDFAKRDKYLLAVYHKLDAMSIAFGVKDRVFLVRWGEDEYAPLARNRLMTWLKPVVVGVGEYLSDTVKEYLIEHCLLELAVHFSINGELRKAKTLSADVPGL
jgi:hypothetical protein